VSKPGSLTPRLCTTRVSGRRGGHGAEFPLALPGRCIALSTEPGDLVLDPFIGSGITALAALELRRRCIGFDISDEYVRVASARVGAVRTSDVALWDYEPAALNGSGINGASHAGVADNELGAVGAKRSRRRTKS
jgi:methylase of polypeptide subunit release factors